MPQPCRRCGAPRKSAGPRGYCDDCRLEAREVAQVKNREDCRAKYAKLHNPPCAEWELWRHMREIARMGGPDANLQSTLSGVVYTLRMGIQRKMRAPGEYDSIRPEKRHTLPITAQT